MSIMRSNLKLSGRLILGAKLYLNGNWSSLTMSHGENEIRRTWVRHLEAL